MIIGVDEVGRGCIAGDLVVCAFALKPDLCADQINDAYSVAMDSKAFKSRSKRTSATEILRAYGLFEIARADPAKIDRLNIRGATLAAMSEAALRLAERMRLVTEVLFDGKDLPAGFGLPGRAIIKGDASVMEISAASMIAKTLRDAEMDLEAVRHPGYGFEKHAGYGTLAHRDAIRRLGLCPIHRSWAEKFSDQSTK